jgi:hypothetical protein
LLCFGVEASERAGMSRRAAGGRLADRLVDRRTDGRADLGVAVRGLETVDLGLAVVALGFAVVDFALVEVRGLAAPLGLDDVEAMEFVDVLGRDAVLDVLALDVLALDVLVRDLLAEDLLVLGLEVDAREVDDRLAAGRRAELVRRAVVLAVGFAVDMVLAAAVSAFAAVIMDLVAVFIACIADDIVLADDVALVAAAVIFVAADVTLVAADDTVLAAEAGVAVLLDEDDLRVEREAVLRAEPEAVRRDAELRVDRADELRVDRDAGVRVVDEAVPAGMAAELRVAVDLARLALLALVVFGRLAVPDALRLTDLLRAVLAELRRVAARFVV